MIQAKLDTCPICNTQFRRKYSRSKQRKIYCSRSCRYKASAIECTCKTCGKSFTAFIPRRNTEYCSRACIERSPCLVCGETITGRASFQSGIRRFCSRKCASIANNCIDAKSNYVVKGFVSTLERIGKIACERCGFSNIFALHVHHVDRDRENNESTNLETLCANCHNIEHWNSSKSKTDKVEVAHFIYKTKDQ
jgi:hypothetical protein